MIVVSLLLFLAGVALLAAGLVGGNILFEVGSIVAALLAAMVLYLAVRQRGGTVPEEVEAPSEQPDFAPLKSTWSQRDVAPAETPEEPVDDSPDWLLDSADKVPEPEHEEPLPVVEAADPALADEEPDEEIVSDADVARVAERNDDVLVVDGRPRYHLQLCPTLGGDETVPLPVSEAREAGFTPCARCRPDSHILGDAWRSGTSR